MTTATQELSSGRMAVAWRHVKGDRRALSAVLLTLGILGVAIFAPILATYDPVALDIQSRHLPPSLEHFFGTDRLGMDVYSRVVWASRVDLFIAISSVLLSIIIGLPTGVLVGYLGGRTDGFVMRAFDVLQAFPVLVLAIAVLATLGRGAVNIVIVVGLIGVPTYVRLARTQVRSMRESSYVEAARSVGNPTPRLVTRYLVPGTLGTTAVQAATSCGWALILTAGLGFLGLGVPVPQPEWGRMVFTGAEDIVSGQWWTSFFPGMAIVVTVFAFNQLGEVLADAVDPRRRKAR